jgi:hypothetical protein
MNLGVNVKLWEWKLKQIVKLNILLYEKRKKKNSSDDAIGNGIALCWRTCLGCSCTFFV